MADGYQGLETARGALEATEGSADTPTRLLYLPAGSVSIEHKVEQSEDSRGWAKFDMTADIFPEIQDVALVVSGAQAGYEDFGWWLSLYAASGSGSPTVVDTSAQRRIFAPSQTDSDVGANGVRSANIEFAPTNLASTRVWQMPGLVGEELTVQFRKRASGTDNGVTWSGRFRTASKPTFATAFNGSLSDYGRHIALGQQFAGFIDANAAGLGGTADANITEAEFSFTRTAQFHDGADGSDAHTSMHRPDGWASELTFTRKFADITEYDHYIGTAFAKGLRAVRLETTGRVVGGTTEPERIQLNFIGKYVDNGAVPVRVDGMWYQEFSMQGLYDATQGASWQFVTVNDVTAAYTTT
jgi:hypothetical protein